jgi:signal transduction histidine kinase/ligand-binding sensor domain-containing protein
MVPGQKIWKGGLVLLLAFLGWAIPVCGNPALTYLHKIWRTEEGLQNPVVRTLIQSRSGYLFLATDEGVCRFDGVQFRDIERKTSTDKVERWMVALSETSDGSLWYSSVNGGLCRVLDGSTTRYTTNNGLPRDYVLCAYEDSKGNLWAGTAAGLARFDGTKFISYTNNPDLPIEAVRTVAEDSSGTLWIGMPNGLFFLKENKFGTFPADQLVSASVMSLCVGRDKSLWVGTAGGLTHLVEGTSIHYTTEQGLAHNTVRSVYETRGGDIFVATHGGVQKLVNGRFEDLVLRQITDEFEGLTFGYSLCEDHEANLWAGTSLGLNRLQSPKISCLAKEEGLPHNLATLVYEDRPGSMWVGTYGGGLCHFVDGRMELLTAENSKLTSNYILSFTKDRTGTYWIGTDLTGLHRWKDGEFKQFLQPNVAANTVRIVFADSQTNLWIGHNAGVDRFYNDTFWPEKNLPRSSIKAIVEDKYTNIWFASKSGLTRWWDGNMKTYKESDGLCLERVNAVYADADGIVWVGTEAGLNRMQELGVFTSFHTPNGPFREHILHILEDDYGKLWFATRNGIFSASKRELNEYAAGRVASVSFAAFGKRDGMRRAQCNGIAQPAGWKSSDGRLWFPTMHGVVHFDPKEMQTNPTPPQVKIESLMVDGRPVPTGASLKLGPRTANFEFQFTALSFQAPEKVNFKYILEGIDSKWEEAGTRRFARYLHLPPGEYVFRVKACNNDGVWDPNGASLSFTKAPNFYQTSTFYWLCFIAVVSGAFGVHKYRISSHERREKELAALVEQRTAKLQEMIKSMEGFNYSIAHDLRAPIRAIRGFTEALVEDYRPHLDSIGCEYAERIQLAVERMDQLIQDLLIYGQLSHKEIPLECVKTDVIFDRILENFASEIQSKKANVQIRKPLPPLWANSTILHQIFSNLLSNALKFVRPNSEPNIEVWAEDRGNVIRVFIRDNGIGIKKEHQERIFRIFERLHPGDVYPGTGIGLAIVQRGVERMGGKVGVDSSQHQGSCFWVEFLKCTDPAKTTMREA